MSKGKVYFVGAGPSNLGLLTLNGKNAIKNSNCIIYDRLIDNRILEFAPKDAELIYFGKENIEGGITQSEINKMIVKKALEGKIVSRVKGGDSFVFGRGGEEILALNEHEIPFEMIPGISSSIAVPEYAGIPVTHRGVANSFHVFTGHLSEESENLDFENIAKIKGTLLFLMGIKNIEYISNELLKYGKNSITPVAIIEKGATENQRVTIGTLSTISKIAKEKKVVPPAVIVIGNVVNLSKDFKWYEKKSLYGKKIVVTRDSKNNSKLSENLIKEGAIIVDLPCIKISENEIEVNEILKKYSAVLFNSPNGVNSFMKNIKDIRLLGNIKIGVVGEKTKEEIEKYKISPDFMPKKYMISELAKEVTKYTKKNDKVLVITSDISPCEAENWEKLYERKFEKLIAYKTEKLVIEKDIIEKKLNNIDYITFLSSSAVEAFYSSIKGEIELLKEIKIVSIGEITSKTLRKLGFKNIIEAVKFDSNGVIDVIKAHVRGEKNV